MQLSQDPEQQDTPEDNGSTASVETEAVESAVVSEETPSFSAWRADLLLAALILVVFITDQVTKAWVRASLIEGASRPREGFLRITHVSNTGSAFGLFPNQTLFLLIASVVGIAVLLVFFRRQAGRGFMVRTSLGLQLGGAAGNLVDRITLGKVTGLHRRWGMARIQPGRCIHCHRHCHTGLAPLSFS